MIGPMVHVRIGSTWKQDPALRAALAAGGATAAEAARGAVDAILVEVDGIDLGAGRAEGPLLAGVGALGEAVLHLLGGNPRSHVHFGDGGVELVLTRRGAGVLLTVVSLGRPGRVLARDVEVDLAELAGVVRDTARALVREVHELHPATAPMTRPLAEVSARLERARPVPAPLPIPAIGGDGTHLSPQRPDGPSCAFELRDAEDLVSSYQGGPADLGSLLAPGRVVLRDAAGLSRMSLEGPPFLALRDLVSFAGSIADAVRRGEPTAAVELAAPGRHATVALEVDLRSGDLICDGNRRPCPPLPLARALCEAAVDLCGVVVARNPWQERNGWITALRGDAAERLSLVEELRAGDVVAAPPGAPVRHRPTRPLTRAPLAPGRLRRVSFQRSWEADVGAPAAGAALALCGDVLVAAGRVAVLGLDPASGEERWRRPGAALASVVPGSVFVADEERLTALDGVTGRERWSVPTAALPHGVPRDVVRAAGGLAVVVAPGEVAALEPGRARVAWRFAPPSALRLTATAIGPLLLVGTDAGFLYGLEAASGRARWRLHLPGPPAAAPAGHADACLVVCVTALGGSLLALDPATGRRRLEVPLDVTPTGGAASFAGLLGIPGTVAGDPVVTAVDPAGRVAWSDAPPFGPGTLAVAPTRTRLLVKASDGTCAALDRGGATAWARTERCEHPPPTNAAPIVARGIALVPAEQVDVLDEATGERLGRAPLLAPIRLVGDAELRAWGLDAEGIVTACRLQRHLSVL